ncbi:hypothetical protein BJX65DRAFT_307514 [Aspergillus insuetus]
MAPTLWEEIAAADTVFSDLVHADMTEQHTPVYSWNLGPETVRRLGEIHSFYECASGFNIEGIPQSSENGSPRFDSLDQVELYLNLYFRYSHSSIPFIHRATFDPGKCSAGLLYVMCIVGVADADPTGSESFLQTCLTLMVTERLAELARNAMRSKGGQCLLSALASSALVLYLSLVHRDAVSQDQCYMLLFQTIHLAEAHGLFDHTNLSRAANYSADISISANVWGCWTRSESVKRLILCLILLESSFTRLFRVPIEMHRAYVLISLPSPESAFQAGSVQHFMGAISSHAGLVAPPVTDIQEHTVQKIDDFAFRILTSLAYLAHHQGSCHCSATDHALRILSTAMPADGHEPRTLLIWNHLRIVSSANMGEIHGIFGKGDVQHAGESLGNFQTWSRTLQARQCVIHAAQNYRILSNSRIPRDNMCHLDTILFDSALVLAAYILYAEDSTVNPQPHLIVLDLIHTLRSKDPSDLWLSIYQDPNNGANLTPPDSNYHGLLRFLNGSSQVCFRQSGTPPQTAVQDIMFSYASLIDEVSPHHGQAYSALLRGIGHQIKALLKI